LGLANAYINRSPKNSQVHQPSAKEGNL